MAVKINLLVGSGEVINAIATYQLNTTPSFNLRNLKSRQPMTSAREEGIVATMNVILAGSVQWVGF